MKSKEDIIRLYVAYRNQLRNTFEAKEQLDSELELKQSSVEQLDFIIDRCMPVVIEQVILQTRLNILNDIVENIETKLLVDASVMTSRIVEIELEMLKNLIKMAILEGK